ncbi:MAG: helix-turn-helix domain-containing protein [Actinomycetota bacterium]|nr:helix-turn-helix domain-containing protein [Actinomycetota bacterium]
MSIETIPQPLTYTVDQAAALLGIARGVAYESVRNGEIPATRVGRRWLIPRSRFHAWLDGEAQQRSTEVGAVA